ncbi:MAG: cupredoxin domain-containing protein [Dehalococcoidales bacterium]
MSKIFSAGRRYFLVFAALTALLVLSACSSSTATTTTQPPLTTTTPPVTTTTPPVTTTTPPVGQPVTINLVAQNMAFDQSTITVSAGAQVTINFNNKDSGIPHNFSLYTDSSASKSLFIGQTITGPKTITYTFTAPATPGNYFFRCDVHPTIMTGTFAVQ